MSKSKLLILLLLIVFYLGAVNTSFIIVTNVSNAEVYIDGFFKGVTSKDGSLFIPSIKSGKHRIEVRKEGYKSLATNFNVSDMGGKAVLKLKKISSVKQTFTTKKTMLYVDTNLQGANVYVDGINVGRTLADGRLVMAVKPGVYSIEVSKPGYKSVRGKVYVEEIGKRIRLDLPKLKTNTTGSNNLIFILGVVFLVIILISVFIVISVVNKKTRKNFGRFILKDLLGKGGMALVYTAYDPKIKKEVALKLMDTGLLKDKDLVEKFIREGQAISRINQQYPEAPVVKVFEFGRLGSNPVIPYIVMEKLKGVSLLDEFKKKGKFEPRRAIWIVKRIAEALMATHKTGVYHRDVTPDNVILIRTGTREDIRLIDFGVAKHEYTSYKTLDGSIAGKPPYMSPEQCKGQKITAKSDIYSLGIIFYMLLEGKPPYSSSNPLEIMKMHENSPIPELTIDIDSKIKALVKMMLAKKPEERPDSVLIITNLELFI